MHYPFIVSATKLKQMLICERLPFMDEHRDHAEKVERAELRMRFDLGVAHEEREAKTVVVERGPVEKCPDDVRADIWTLEQMRRGRPHIGNGLLVAGDWWGAPDWLVRRPGKSLLGKWHYEPSDAKFTKDGSQAKFIVPVIYYAMLLERVQGVLPRTVEIRALQSLRVNVQEHVSVTTKHVENLSRILGGKDPGPFLTSECAKCQWIGACSSDAKAMDHLSQISGMRRRTVAALSDVGVTRLDELAKLKESALVRLPFVKHVDTARRMLAQAAAYADGKARIVGTPLLPSPSAVEAFIDFEGLGEDSTYDIVLLGVLIRRGRRFEIHQQVATSRRDIAANVQRWLDVVRALGRTVPIFHYGSYDQRTLAALGGRRAKSVLARFVDVLPQVKNHVALPSRGQGLKDVAGALGFRWRTRDAGGHIASQHASAWIDHGRTSSRGWLLRYNREDLRALQRVAAWIRRPP